MRVLTLLLVGGVALSSWGCSGSRRPDRAGGNGPGEEQSRTVAEPGAPVAYRVSGPYTHENFSLYLIHGDDQRVGGPLTGQPAIVQPSSSTGFPCCQTSSTNRLT